MINLNRSDIHGFTDSFIDGRIRVRTADGNIVTFNISDKGLEASMQDQKLTVPVEISNVTDPIKLMHILKVYTIKASDGQLKIAPIARTVDGNIVTFNITDKETEVMVNGQKLIAPAELRNANNLKDLLKVLSKHALKVESNIRLIPVERKTKDINLRAVPENCAADGCAAQACGADGCAVAACAADGCAVAGCASQGSVADACLANGCAANGCGAQGCGVNGCAVDGCGAQGCGANGCAVAGCGAQGCPINGCAVDGCGAQGCEANTCGGNGCAGQGCPLNKCAGATCGGQACAAAGCPLNVCAGDLCTGYVCGAQGGVTTCLGNVCAGLACAIDVTDTCVGNAQVFPCVINLPYCFFVL